MSDTDNDSALCGTGAFFDELEGRDDNTRRDKMRLLKTIEGYKTLCLILINIILYGAPYVGIKIPFPVLFCIGALSLYCLMPSYL
jgi:hypothetical protein